MSRIAIGQRLEPDLAEPRAQHMLGIGRSQVVRMAGTRVIGVSVRDHRALDRPPGIDVEIAGWAVQALGSLDDQGAPVMTRQDDGHDFRLAVAPLDV